MTVYLVGAGPGGIGLLTVRARELLDAAEVILYDQLPGEEIIASLPRSAELIDVGKFGCHHTMKQSAIEELLIEKAREGKTVVRLKGGDPFVFGRGGEELQVLRKAGVAVEVVPGITSGIAVPENAGIAVTHRDFASSVTFVTGHESPDKEVSAVDWDWLAKCPGTIVIYMGVKQIAHIAASLLNGGMSGGKKVAVIENGFRKNQRVTVTTLAELADTAVRVGFCPPAIIVIGDVVGMYEEK